MKNPKQEINWQPEHFPQGTIVRLQSFKSTGGKVGYTGNKDNFIDVTIKHLLYCGCDQGFIAYSLDEGTVTPEFMFNLSHVHSVVKRGAGKVVFKNDFTTFDNTQYYLNNILSGSLRKNKNRYYWNFLDSSPLLKIINSHNPHIDVEVNETFLRDLMKQTFVKTINIGHNFKLHSVNKKKVKLWIKQNINRHLVSKKEALKKIAEYELSKDRLFDRDLYF